MNLTRRSLLALAGAAAAAPASALAPQQNPYIGSWALTVPGGGPGWLGVSESGGRLSASMMWIGGSVFPIDEARIEGDALILTRRLPFEERGAGGARVRRIAVETIRARRRGDVLEMTTSTRRPETAAPSAPQAFTGKLLPPMPPAPDLSSVRFGRPIRLFNGRDLSGWRLTDPNAVNGWRVERGELVNQPVQTPGAPHKNYGNLRTDREFGDFRIRLDVNLPKGGNSGVYLRGVYEVQMEDSYGQPADSHRMGGVYSRITPVTNAARPAGEWQHVDITLVDRHVTVVLNGVRIIDNQPVVGPTGGALWSDVLRRGPIYLQGDHDAVRYRNILLEPVIAQTRTRLPEP
jgi:hypothetical protein